MENRFLSRAVLVAMTLAAAACNNNTGDDTQFASDSGTQDETSSEGGGDDASAEDAGTTVEAGGDSGSDATAPMGGGNDAAGNDAGASDASTSDAHADDASANDAAGHDAGSDSSTGTGTEAGSEAGPDAGSDAGGAGTDAGGPLCGYASTVLADHPLAYLRLDDTSGLTAADATGNGNTGTFKGGVTLGVPGAITSCLGETAVTLDGNTGWIDLGDKFGFTGSAPFSLEIWINPSTITGEFRGVMAKNSTDGSNQRQGYDVFSVDGLQYGTALGYERYQSGQTGFAGIGPNGTDAGTAAAPIVGAWMHVVAVFDGTNQMIYTNGALTAGPSPSSEVIQTQTGCSFAVGAFFCGTVGYFAGTVDEVAIYGTALSAAQVQAHYQAAQVGNGLVVISPGNTATVSGPVLFQVTASESVVVNQIQVWDNGNKLGAYPNTNSSATWQYFTQSYTLSSGSHATTVLDLDDNYAVIHQTTVDYTVQ